jgi:hypothetical protein
MMTDEILQSLMNNLEDAAYNPKYAARRLIRARLALIDYVNNNFFLGRE